MTATSARDVDERSDLRGVARAFLDLKCGSAAVRHAIGQPSGYDWELWARMVELGWVGMLIPTELGGGGADFADAVVILEELGRRVTPGPFLGSAVLASSALLLGGDDEQRVRWLPALASGASCGALATCGATGSPDPEHLGLRAKDGSAGVVIDGSAAFVPDGSAADILVLACRQDSGVTLVVVDRNTPGLTVTPTATVDETRRLAEVRCDDVSVPRDRILGEAGAGEPILQQVLARASVAIAADCLGGAEWSLADTVEYARERRQFGRPIGSFQAIKHMCADLHVLVQGAQVAVDASARAVDLGGKGTVIAAAIAKLRATEAFSRVAADAIQLHGGIGYTSEHDAHLYLKRAKLNQALYGGPRWQRERIASLTLGPAPTSLEGM